MRLWDVLWFLLENLVRLLKVEIWQSHGFQKVVVLCLYIHRIILIYTTVSHIRVPNRLWDPLASRIWAYCTYKILMSQIWLVHTLGNMILHIYRLFTHRATFIALSDLVFILQIFRFFHLCRLLLLFLERWLLHLLFHSFNIFHII